MGRNEQQHPQGGGGGRAAAGGRRSPYVGGGGPHGGGPSSEGRVSYPSSNMQSGVCVPFFSPLRSIREGDDAVLLRPRPCLSTAVIGSTTWCLSLCLSLNPFLLLPPLLLLLLFAAGRKRGNCEGPEFIGTQPPEAIGGETGDRRQQERQPHREKRSSNSICCCCCCC